jgi:hypothetical protein
MRRCLENLSGRCSFRRNPAACAAAALGIFISVMPPVGGTAHADPPGEGFLSTAFLHETVEVNDEYRSLLRLIMEDSLAANIQYMQDYGTRYAYTPQVKKAGRWLMKRLVGFGYTDTLYQKLLLGNDKVKVASGNVSATKPGKTKPEYRVIIGSHYDSITFGQAVPPAEEAPGADDNASGTSAVLEIARILADVETDASVQFVSFTGHEVGMLGSHEFAVDLADQGAPPEHVFFLNLDMIGNANGPPPWTVKIHDNVPSRPLAELGMRIGEAYTPLIPRNAGERMADQTNFHDQGYRAFFIHEGDFNTANYHSRTDLLENLEMPYEKEVTQMAMAIVLHLANLADPPEDVRAVQNGPGEVLVNWSHSPDADLLGYHVEIVDGEGLLVDQFFTSDNSVTLNTELLGEGCRVRVRAEDVLGAGDASSPVLIGQGENLVACASPNPTGGPCRFEIFVPGSGSSVEASVRVVDAMGRHVATVSDAPLERGSNTLSWDGLLSNGERAPGGIFFYVVETKGAGGTLGKIALVR